MGDARVCCGLVLFVRVFVVSFPYFSSFASGLNGVEAGNREI